jgi:hypothetical protein
MTALSRYHLCLYSGFHVLYVKLEIKLNKAFFDIEFCKPVINCRTVSSRYF